MSLHTPFERPVGLFRGNIRVNKKSQIDKCTTMTKMNNFYMGHIANEDLITVETRKNSEQPVIHIWATMWKKILFDTLGAGGGGGGFNNHNGPILVNIYPLIYINLHVEYRSNVIWTFWVKINVKSMKNSHFLGVLGGPDTLVQWIHGYQSVKQEASRPDSSDI